MCLFMNLFKIQNWSIDLQWKVLLLFNVIQNSGCSLDYYCLPSAEHSAFFPSLGFLIWVWESSQIYFQICACLSSCAHSLGSKRVFSFHLILREVCDPKNAKNHCFLRIRNQIFLLNLALLLHLLYCQGVCVGEKGDLNLFLVRKNTFL